MRLGSGFTGDPFSLLPSIVADTQSGPPASIIQLLLFYGHILAPAETLVQSASVPTLAALLHRAVHRRPAPVSWAHMVRTGFKKKKTKRRISFRGLQLEE